MNPTKAGDLLRKLRDEDGQRITDRSNGRLKEQLLQAQLQCQRLAAEVARLQAGAKPSGERVYKNFYDLARIVLSERTWRRILALAEERAGIDSMKADQRTIAEGRFGKGP